MATQNITFEVTPERARQIGPLGKTKIRITCKACKDKYVLRAVLVELELDSGFKSCVCGNTTDFHFEEIPVTTKERPIEQAAV